MVMFFTVTFPQYRLHKENHSLESLGCKFSIKHACGNLSLKPSNSIDLSFCYHSSKTFQTPLDKLKNADDGSFSKYTCILKQFIAKWCGECARPLKIVSKAEPCVFIV